MPGECVGEETTAGAAHGVTRPHPASHRLALRPTVYFKGHALRRHHGTGPLLTAVTSQHHELAPLGTPEGPVTSQHHELAPLGTPELSCDVTTPRTSSVGDTRTVLWRHKPLPVLT